ncbi:response regulator [Leptospira kemamanensis]|uniref:Response regulator n=1 Tax=Leptospira kemamanensis TaxID=2484942 RepID=A0A4R9JVY0_9LEPT|nr:response regulator [Leptospira kemamanensis]TGL55586.1 response regulator [Leptospira kemamanensis]
MKKISKVFLIEDDLVTTFLIKTLMEKFSFASEIITFSNGDVALHTLQNSETYPDLLFLDLNMPVMDGWQFLEEIQNRSPLSNIPTYILTSSIDPLDRSRSTQFPNVKGYLVKPLSWKDLQSIQEG